MLPVHLYLWIATTFCFVLPHACFTLSFMFDCAERYFGPHSGATLIVVIVVIVVVVVVERGPRTAWLEGLYDFNKLSTLPVQQTTLHVWWLLLSFPRSARPSRRARTAKLESTYELQCLRKPRSLCGGGCCCEARNAKPESICNQGANTNYKVSIRIFKVVVLL